MIIKNIFLSNCGLGILKKYLINKRLRMARIIIVKILNQPIKEKIYKETKNINKKAITLSNKDKLTGFFVLKIII
jgi:hypothetical protein